MEGGVHQNVGAKTKDMICCDGMTACARTGREGRTEINATR